VVERAFHGGHGDDITVEQIRRTNGEFIELLQFLIMSSTIERYVAAETVAMSRRAQFFPIPVNDINVCHEAILIASKAQGQFFLKKN
jgi:hypothetical protein